ncbi:LAQU0S01e11980g1_1 [Lachancea quebecensis]|uniref:ATP-dependent DNA helicase II subunit 2 n=1 Tax=Lachancea quebecensis TaxID=1654605 RepID=A0A0P1KLQ9_9SACH|nr:LAQU0S01e11980g1_1 [Lachancea quebecensis]
MGSEATTFIVDVSPSMVELGHVEQAVAYIEYTLFLKSKKQRKTDWVNCFLANCPYTRNNHETANVFELMPFTAPIGAHKVIEMLQELKSLVDKSTQGKNDINSMVQCLLVSSVCMRDEFKKRKVRKRIIVFTDNLNGLDLTEEEVITLEQELDCSIVLVTCGIKEEEQKAPELTIWRKCIQRIAGSVETSMTTLLQEISTHRPAVVKPVRIFQGELRLGAPIIDEEVSEPSYDSITVKVEGYPATKAVSSLNRRVVAKSQDGGFEPVKSVIEYEAVEDEGDSESGVASVSKDYVTKAYRYGSDYVVLPQAIESERIYKTAPGLDLRGFVGNESIPRHFLSSESIFIIPATKDGTRADFVSFSALVDSMIKLKKFAIARYVQKVNSEVQMCLLCPVLIPKKRKAPSDDETYTRALVLNRLPFAEDERCSDYPKLAQATAPSNAETAEVDALMGELIDSMDLGTGPDQTWCSTPLYRPFDPTVLEPTLPLPRPIDSRDLEIQDALCVPAIGIYRQQQILIEYMHQRIVQGSVNFEVPGLPYDLRKQLFPSHKPSKSTLSRLQELLDIKINSSRANSATPNDEQQDEDEFQEIPSLESLLARGRS